ncbi:unnamed protein product [Polarella glacialis]|uniref:UBA domain-containing protein n=1 Tax=Polarella glacialis TaxID=89957 RepID=A0A813H3I1_POLGL|nr:unnamed protein product [Polarella glacialis]
MAQDASASKSAVIGKMTSVLRLAKDRANEGLGKVKEMKERAQERAHRFTIGSGPAAGAGQLFGSGSPVSSVDHKKVERLIALGFTAAAARHALRICGGRLNEAGVWLLDASNTDEILAAEVAAQEASPLCSGGTARVAGLRGAADLNGAIVTLHTWDADSERWVVSLPDGSIKAIRARNLDPVSCHPVGKGGAAASQETAFSPPSRAQGAQGVQGAQVSSGSGKTKADDDAETAAVIAAVLAAEEAEEAASASKQRASATASGGKPAGAAPERPSRDDVDLEELRTLARDMASSNGQPLDEEVLFALDAADLLQLVDSLSLSPKDRDADEAKGSSEVKPSKPSPSSSSSRRPDGERRPSCRPMDDLEAASASSTTAAAESETRTARGVVDADRIAEEQRLKEAETRYALLEEAQRNRARELEAREASLLEAERKLEEKRAEVSQRRGALATPPDEVEDTLRQAASPSEPDFSEAPSTPTSPAAASMEAELDAQREELRRLGAEVEAAARALEERQAASQLASEERELRLLEEESAQLRMASTLQEEEARLTRQRRSLGMLQQALFKGAREEKLSRDGTVELSLDDGALDAEEPTLGSGSDPEEEEEPAPGGGHAERTESCLEQGADEENTEADAEDENEVWDLDWSTLSSPKQQEASLTSKACAEEAVVPSAEEAVTPSPQL